MTNSGNQEDPFDDFNEILVDDGKGIYFAELQPDDPIFRQFHLELHNFRNYQISRTGSEDVLVLRLPPSYVEKIVDSWVEYQQQKYSKAACEGEDK